MTKAMSFPKIMKDIDQKAVQTPGGIYTKKLMSKYIRIRCTQFIYRNKTPETQK